MNPPVIIPVALQIVADDFGWHNGRDQRSINKPSRSGLPRDHAPEDCYILNELGKAIDMKILAPFVIGEWDKDNLLRGLKHATYDEAGWDRASEIDMRMAEKYFEAAENSNYIEYAYHGLLHGYYKNNKQICESEYSRPLYDPVTNKHDSNVWECIPADEMQLYIDTFFRIYDSWGFRKKIRSFVSPGGVFTPPEKTQEFVKILKQNGFIHWADDWDLLNDTTAVIEGITYLERNQIVGWNQYDVDPAMIQDHCTGAPYSYDGRICPACGYHWTNFLRLNPESNMDHLRDWVKYFKRQGAIYGQMLSRDVGFASSQAVYSRFGNVRTDGNRCVIDLTNVDAQKSLAQRDVFYISSKVPVKPHTCTGGAMSLYEKSSDLNPHYSHTTWQITRINNSKEISFELT